MSKKHIHRRTFLGIAATSGLAMPALLSATRVNAAEIERMAGQLLIVGFPGSSVDERSTKALQKHIASGRAGGALFLRHNVKSGAKAKAMAKAFLASGDACLNAIDQEGGAVQRLGTKQGFSEIPRARWVAENKSVDQARTLYARAGRELRSAGFNMNMAPSVDIHDPKNPVIGKWGRGFSTDVERISSYAGAFVDGFAAAGVACSLKHFPGHGSSRGDSHDGFVDITNTWSETELTPFKRLANKAPMIMGGHLFHPEFSERISPPRNCDAPDGVYVKAGVHTTAEAWTGLSEEIESSMRQLSASGRSGHRPAHLSRYWLSSLFLLFTAALLPAPLLSNRSNQSHERAPCRNYCLRHSPTGRYRERRQAAHRTLHRMPTDTSCLKSCCSNSNRPRACRPKTCRPKTCPPRKNPLR